MTSVQNPINLFWFRRDLRLNDNAALYHALKSKIKTKCIFIFDKDILDLLENKSDLRVQFIFEQIVSLKKQLQELGSDIDVFCGKPKEIWNQIFEKEKITAIYFNQDYEPYAKQRDLEIESLAKKNNTQTFSFKDQVVFDYSEILKSDQTPYTVYTPYSKKWKEKCNSFYLSSYPTQKYFGNFLKFNSIHNIKSLEELGFKTANFDFPATSTSVSIIKNYEKNRDIPSLDATSKLSLHFRFGTISIREKARKALEISEKWLNELIWRDFYSQILAHFPKVVNESFKPKYDFIEWENNTEHYQLWQQGKTGYPLVDAGMRELNSTGFMHNRVRMVVASFLCKHLLIDWRWGEAYFAQKLLDFDLASNNGGWQWAAGSGVDAAPYFRVFNPTLQQEKFDSNFIYIKKWVPEFGTSNYPKPIVIHEFARDRCLQRYKKALNEQAEG